MSTEAPDLVGPFNVIDGRHRLWAAQRRGITHMRCDVHHASGVQLRVLPIDELVIDKDVQLAFSFKEAHAKRLAEQWDLSLVGVLVCCTKDIDAARKAQIKMGFDRQRRNVSTLEHFKERVIAGEADATAIERIVGEHGYRIGKVKKSAQDDMTIESAMRLDTIYQKLGEDGLGRTLSLMRLWFEEPRSCTGFWIEGLSLLVRDGYDESLSDVQLERLRGVIPAKVLKRAQGAAIAGSNMGNASGASPIGYEVAAVLRRTARLRKRPVVQRGHKAKPIA